MILYFPVAFPVYNICRKLLFAGMTVSNVTAWRKLKKSLFDRKISRALKFLTYYFEKLNFFPSKNYLAFLIIERYDTVLTNIKISDKNILPLGSAQAPEGGSFLLLFWNFADFGIKYRVRKKSQVQNFIAYGN